MMDTGSIFINLAIFLAAALWIIRPFFQDRNVFNGQGREASSLLAEKERLMSALEDLDQEFALQKISEADYQKKRDFLINQAAGVLKRLDQLDLDSGLGKTRPAVTSASSGDNLEALIASRRQKIRQETRDICPQCGGKIEEKDQFCGNCGEAL